MTGHHGDCGIRCDTGFLTLATTGANVRIDGGGKHAIHRGSALFQGDRRAFERTCPIAGVAVGRSNVAVALPRMAKDRHAHARIVDIGDFGTERTGGAGLQAGNVNAHCTRDIPCMKVGRARGQRHIGVGQAQGIERTCLHAQTAADACGAKLCFRQRPGRPDDSSGQGQRLSLQSLPADGSLDDQAQRAGLH